MYELGNISSGRAAEMANLDRKIFLTKLKPYRISVFNYSLDELEREIPEAKERADIA